MDEMREGMLSPVLILWWTYLVLVTPVWTDGGEQWMIWSQTHPQSDEPDMGVSLF